MTSLSTLWPRSLRTSSIAFCAISSVHLCVSMILAIESSRAAFNVVLPGYVGFVVKDGSVISDVCSASVFFPPGFLLLSDLLKTGILAVDDGFESEDESFLSDACLSSALFLIGSILLGGLSGIGLLTGGGGFVAEDESVVSDAWLVVVFSFPFLAGSSSHLCNILHFFFFFQFPSFVVFKSNSS